MKYTISVTFTELKAARKLLGKMTAPLKVAMGLTEKECTEELEFYCKISDAIDEIRRRKI